MDAEKQGKAFQEAIDFLKQQTGKMDSSSVGDYVVYFTSESACGLYEVMPEGGLDWQPPSPSENQHIEIIVQDKQDSRFVPHLNIFYELRDIDNNFISQDFLPFVWHPIVYHYGKNIEIPLEGEYKIKLTIKAPEFLRHDEMLGKRYESDVTIELGPIDMKPGQISNNLQ